MLHHDPTEFPNPLYERHCQFYAAVTSDCLRPYEAMLYSLERGSIDLCKVHFKEQAKRDRRWREIEADRILREQMYGLALSSLVQEAAIRGFFR